MKILWIVNTIFPYPAQQLKIEKTVFGGWLNGLANKLKEEKSIKLAIATTYNGKNIKKFCDEDIIYYLIPKKYNSKMEENWKIINDEFKPDLVHIHGTEFSHGLAFINACPNVKKITSIQGLVSVYANVYYGDINCSTILKNITIRDILKGDNIIQQRKKFIKKGKNEIKIIKNSDAILGRTTWDYANTKYINKSKKYYIANETLREEFYKHEWKIENVERHTIFCSQASYPIKGIHYLIETVYILKELYPDIKLYIAGNNILDNSNLKVKIKRNGYAKYIQKLIKQYNLQNHVIFTGLLNEKQMVERLLKTHIFVLPSAIENSSNSLGEAMLLGMPCVASNTGGTMDILEHKKEGYLYPYTEPAMCATYIEKLFENDENAIMLGNNARKTALERHNQDENVKQIIKIYNKIIENNKTI